MTLCLSVPCSSLSLLRCPAWSAVRKLLYVATTRKYSVASVSAVTRMMLSKSTGLARRELSKRPFAAWSSAGITCSSLS